MKKQVTTRKRALISSVAMLLVAILALGTATYAWFVNVREATVDGIEIDVVAPEGLLISKDGTDWATRLTYEIDEKLNPVSGFSGTSTDMFEGILKDTDIAGIGQARVDAQATADDYWVDTVIYAKLDGEAQTATDLSVTATIDTVTGTDKELEDLVRIGFTGTDIKEQFIFANKATAYQALKATTTGYTAKSDAYILKAADTENTAVLEEVTPIINTASTVLIENLDQNAKEFTVRLWLEGQDPVCTPAAVLSAAAIELELAI